MIYIERVITIAKGNASIDEQIVLYKGDKNVEIQFAIKNNPFKQKNGLMPTFGQLVINREAGPIFSEVAQVINNKVLFVVTGDMIDVAGECGDYDFQIRLFNEDKTSRVTLPPINAGILIEEPICEEEGVNAATVNYSRTRSGEGEVLDPFNESGIYNKTVWADGDLITDSKLNKVEEALYSMKNLIRNNASSIDILEDLANDFDDDITAIKTNYATKNELTNYATQSYVNNAISNIDIPEIDLTNYATKDELTSYATETYVKTAIAEAQLDGGEVDLSGYATKDDIGDINAILDNLNGEVI